MFAARAKKIFLTSIIFGLPWSVVYASDFTDVSDITGDEIDDGFKRRDLLIKYTLSDDYDGVLVQSYGIGEEFENADSNVIRWNYEELRQSGWGEKHNGKILSLGYRFADPDVVDDIAISIFDLGYSQLWDTHINIVLIEQYLDARVSSGEFLWWHDLKKNDYELKLQSSFERLDLRANQQRIFVSDDNIIDDFGVSARHHRELNDNFSIDFLATYHGRCARFNSQFYWSPEQCEETAAPGLEISFIKNSSHLTAGFRREFGVNQNTDDSNSYSLIYGFNWANNFSLSFTYLRGDSHRSENPYWWSYAAVEIDCRW